ncbi:uncharacterized protein VICG_01023 [Vittaforma corneae ATCC 50505]|uniref:Elongator complex protein 1 n=1 Tax=Vittaforma corneae (strain ATCC 50505) TaxID=993615 RepID=L2GMD3_VITCO|nr:uncharacterized protein VICG_01023 [Vittaforma corneae ATCC 50505]ELA42006.1 hypothetical protein VICG_01023 [Vittaforma corneae ATCC 50505]
MENFFIKGKSQLNVSDKSIYDNSAFIENRSLKTENTRIELPFTPIFMRNLSFDYFLISKDQTLYRINKHKKEIENIGMITDKILAIECAYDKIVILTDKEILLFNAYFNLENSVELESVIVRKSENQSNTIYDSDISVPSNSTFKIRFGDWVFAVIFPSFSLIFDFDLKTLGIIDESIVDAVFIKKYNKFACLHFSSKKIRFFEPNGLEHGDSLDAFGDSLCILKVGGGVLLIANESGVSGYYMKNFFWYKKFTLKGKFYGIEDNSIIMKENGYLCRYYVYRELSDGLVINGNELYYSNFQRAIIPPPFYYKKIAVNDQIHCFSFNKGSLVIVTSLEIHSFLIDKNDNITKTGNRSFAELNIGQPLYADVVEIDGSLIIRTNETVVYLNNRLENCVYDLQNIKDISPSQILKLCDVKGSLAVFCMSGQFCMNSFSITFDFKLTSNFDIQFNSDYTRIYFLSNGVLQYSGIANNTFNRLEQRLSNMSLDENLSPFTYMTDVSSFLIHKQYVLCIIKDALNIVNLIDGATFSSYAEDDLELLTVRGENIILYTRFGTLETISCKLFSLDVVRKLISENKIEEAARKCDKNHIKYSVFFESGEFPSENIRFFDDSQALSMFECMAIPESTCLLSCEYLERLDLNFDYDSILKNMTCTEYNNSCIDVDIILPFFEGFKNFPTRINSYENLKNCEFLFEPLKHTQAITLEPSFSNVNALLRGLNPRKHFSTIINIFIALNRIDLCFYLSDLSKAVKILLTKLSPETICKSSLATFDIEKIIDIHKLCQRDYSTFVSFHNSSKNAKFSVYDYLEKWKLALFYLVEESLEACPTLTADSPEFTQIGDYAVKHNLFDQLLMYTFYNVFKFNFYEFVAKHKQPLDSFYLYKLSGNVSTALRIAKDHLFWKEALELDHTHDVCFYFANLLVQNSRFSEVAEIVEKYFKDYSSAIELYLKGRCISKALSLYKRVDFESGMTYDNIKKKMAKEKVASLIRSTSISYLKNDFIVLNNLLESLGKYKDRLAVVRERLNENMAGTQTTFSYSSLKSSKKALLKDRPGGIFENEYVMNKIRTIALDINKWRIQAEDLLDVFNEFGESSASESLHRHFDPVKTTLKKEINTIWDYRRTDIDFELPNVAKPELSGYFD